MSPATAEARHRLLRLLRLSQATAAQRIRSVASRSRAKKSWRVADGGSRVYGDDAISGGGGSNSK